MSCRSRQRRVARGEPYRVSETSLERRSRARGCLAVALLAVLAACAPERPPRVVRVTYACDEGQGFVARYEHPGEVILELGDGRRVLPEVAAIAGTRFDDGTHELRLEGRTATLRGTAATYSNCVARDWQESERG
jgi:membrane-bound inhibitor of C-type lysozyme